MPVACHDGLRVVSVGTPATGLTAAEAAERLEKTGPNELRREAVTSLCRILGRQFASPVIALLAVSSVIALVLGEVADGVAILTIIALNGLIGFFQEYRAERAVLALRAMTAPRARVRRDGHAVVVPAATVVPGDLLLLEPGDLVAADAQIVEANVLAVNEAALTGESVAVDKDPTPLDDQVALADRRDRVFAGTAVVAGTGVAEVFATGMESQLGHIATLLESAHDEATPLQVQLAGVSRTLIRLCLGVVALVAVIGFFRGVPWLEVLLSSVSLAVAAVPEGLPAVVTIALAVGVERMARQNVLVRRLAAVETLGSATVICTDKTGTLTTGEMHVRETWGADTQALTYAAAACNDADLTTRTGSPTELRNLAFTTLVFVELFRAFAARSPTRTLWQVGAFSNPRLLIVVGASVALQIGMHHLPLTQRLFGLTPLGFHDCLLPLGLGLVPVTVLEGVKLMRRRR
ncbi:hypothetical protein LBMAG42_35980 [Deltaproteobacteria bacterium]|nr:hypothetical protein LBMAG42_35980 [Deltaproteobacteria bacterium]